MSSPNGSPKKSMLSAAIQNSASPAGKDPKPDAESKPASPDRSVADKSAKENSPEQKAPDSLKKESKLENESVAVGSGLGSRAALNLFPVREHSPGRLLLGPGPEPVPMPLPFREETRTFVEHSPNRFLVPPQTYPLLREGSPVRSTVVINRASPVRPSVVHTISRSPVRSRSPFREIPTYVNSTIKQVVHHVQPVVHYGAVSVSNSRTIQTHIDLTAARQDQYSLDQARHA